MAGKTNKQTVLSPVQNDAVRNANSGLPAAACAMIALAAVGAAFYGIRLWLTPGGYADLWFHLKTGEWILANHRLPPGDIFSAAYQANEWIVNAWLSEILLRLLFSLGGIATLQAAQAAASLVIFTAVGIFAYRISEKPVFSLLIAVLSLVSGYHRHSLRPELFSMILIVLVLVILYQYKTGASDKLWWLVPIGALWSNLHMGFITAFAVLGCILAGDGIAAFYYARKGIQAPQDVIRGLRLRRLAWFTAAMAAATLMNPYGPEAWLFMSQLSGQFSTITEWLPLPSIFSMNNLVTISALGLLTAVSVGALLLSRQAKDISGMLLIIVFSILTWRFVRQTGQFSLVAPFVAAAALRGVSTHRILPVSDRLRSVSGAAGVVVLVIALYWGLYGLNLPANGEFGFGLSKTDCSESAVRFLEENGLAGNRIFNSFELGGWLSWNLWPDQKIHMDGRLDMYGEKANQQYFQIIENQLAPRRLDLMGIDCCYFRHPVKKAKLHAAKLLAGDQNWALVFYDDTGLVYLRRKPRFQEIISRYEYRIINPLAQFKLQQIAPLYQADQVMKEINQSLEQGPDSLNNHYMAGLAWLALRNPTEAKADLLKARELCVMREPSAVSRVEQSLGHAEMEAGDASEAITHLKEALRLAGEDIGQKTAVLNDLGTIYARNQEYQQAEEAFRQALDTGVETGITRFNLGRLKMAQGRYDEAAPYFDEILRSVPGDIDACISLAQCFAMLGRTDDALDLLEAAAKQNRGAVLNAAQAPEFTILRQDPRLRELLGH